MVGLQNAETRIAFGITLCGLKGGASVVGAVFNYYYFEIGHGLFQQRVYRNVQMVGCLVGRNNYADLG